MTLAVEGEMKRNDVKSWWYECIGWLETRSDRQHFWISPWPCSCSSQLLSFRGPDSGSRRGARYHALIMLNRSASARETQFQHCLTGKTFSTSAWKPAMSVTLLYARDWVIFPVRRGRLTW